MTLFLILVDLWVMAEKGYVIITVAAVLPSKKMISRCYIELYFVFGICCTSYIILRSINS